MKLARYLIVIPAFFMGCVFGQLIFAFIPGFVIATLWYGKDAFQHLEIIDFLVFHATMIGGFFVVYTSIIIIRA